MKRYLHLIVVLLLGVSSVSSAELTGRVINSNTGQAIPGATVRLQPGDNGVVSDSAGGFVFDSIYSDSRYLAVSCVGYEPIRLCLADVTDHSRPVIIELTAVAVPVGDITVTASRFAEDNHNAPQNVSVTSRKELLSRSFSTTAEALREEPGILVQKTTHGHGAPIIRGLIGRYVLLLYDGFRLNKPTFRFGGNQYLNTVNRESLDRIEVVRGPSSVMYGSDAIGGVVNLIPGYLHNGTNGFHLTPILVGRYASADNSDEVHLQLDGAGSRFGGSVALTLKEVGDLRGGGDIGRQVPTSFSETGFTMRSSYAISARSRMRFDYLMVRQHDIFRYDKYESGDFDTFLYEPQNRDFASLVYDYSRADGRINAVRAGLCYQHEKEGRTQRRAGSIVTANSTDRISSWGGYVQMSIALADDQHLTLGGEHYQDVINSEREETDTSGTISVRPTYPDDSEYTSTGIFAQHRWQVADQLALTGGLRYSVIRIKSQLELPFGEYDKDFDDLTGSVSLRYRLLPELNLVSRWSRGFRAPNLNDATVLKYSSSGVDAPSLHLEPENSNAIELGIKAAFPRVSGSLFWHRNRLSDLIDRRPGTYDGLDFFDENGNGIRDAGEFDIYQKFNVGRAVIQGIEGHLAVRLTDRMGTRLNAFWTDGENTSNSEPLSRIPPVMGLAGITVQISDDVSGEAFVRFAGSQRRLSQRDIDDTRIDPNGTPGWATLNLRAIFTRDLLSATVTLENLADKAYKEHGSGIYSAQRGLVLSVSYGGN